ncbi:MAG: SRPBCC domain-containing protein [Rhodospirillaceae bacterium]|nr:SRPBCC domain-containing protein [Rhodospirillaceae bacterium]
MAQHELVITRTFDAPRALVFKAWSAAEHAVRWFGPKNFTCPHCKIDFRVGGAYRACIRSPEGKEYWMRGIYREIVEPERIVFTFSWEEDGERGRENLITVTFAEQGGQTRMTFRQAFFESIEQRDSHNEGWSECFERLAQFLAGER